jgi:Uma2 family endonuclease
MSAGPAPPVPAPIITPTVEVWRAMSPVERERFLVRVLDALSDPVGAMSEGRPHKKAKTRTLDRLGLHFSTVGRAVYLAEEMAVLYPGAEPFTPDVLAVVDVVEPEDDQRMAWVVADEGKGVDLVLEVLHHGDRKKDLVANVDRYAALGIAEYFVYDRAEQRIHGFRLPPGGARRYQRLVPQGGRYTSTVLGLDLAVAGGALRFYVGQAELPGTADLIGRLHGMVGELIVKADEVAAELAEANARADQAATRADQAMEALRATLLALLEARGIPCPEDARARVAACDDPATLQRWILRASIASSATEALSAL